MTLALCLGRTFRELVETMDAAEFDMWIEYNRRSPIGPKRGDLQAGIVAATIANYAGKARKDGAPAATPLDYMPLEKRPEVDESPDPVSFFGGM
jgi:hypothetical protein